MVLSSEGDSEGVCVGETLGVGVTDPEREGVLVEGLGVGVVLPATEDEEPAGLLVSSVVEELPEQPTRQEISIDSTMDNARNFFMELLLLCI